MQGLVKDGVLIGQSTRLSYIRGHSNELVEKISTPAGGEEATGWVQGQSVVYEETVLVHELWSA